MILSFLRMAFAAFAMIIAAIVVLFVVPIDRAGKLFHATARAYSRTVLKVCGIKLCVEGLEKLDFSRSYIYVSNHASQFDIPAVIAGIPDQIRIVYKKELEAIPLFGWGLKFPKVYIGIDRKKGQDALQSLEAAAEKIRNGASVLLFAEGTRSPDGKLQQFKRGAFNLAVKSGVPVVPLTINGSYNVLSKNSLRVKPGTIALALGTPIEPPAQNGKETELKLREQVESIIKRQYQDQSG
jgi:1-acyl-sn-glycerol-3-phosphate acyltransferase